MPLCLRSAERECKVGLFRLKRLAITAHFVGKASLDHSAIVLLMHASERYVDRNKEG